jgi:hypothetical protein
MKPRKPVSRLVNPSILRQLGRGLLRRLLEPFRDFLEKKGIDLPPEVKKRKDYDFGTLSKALLDDDDRPQELLHALEAVGKMSDIHGAEILKRDLSVAGADGEESPKKIVPADLALQAYLDHPELFESASMEKQVVDIRRYKCFVPVEGVDITKARFEPEVMAAVEREIGHFFGDEENGCQIIPSREAANVRWFVIIHGGRKHRQPIFKKGDHQHIEFEPENDDVVRINTATGEVWIHAKLKSEFDSYRKIFGKHILGNPEAFKPAERIFTLEPLRTLGEKSLKFDDIAGCPMKSASLKYVEVLADKHNGLIHRISCKNDLFACTDAAGSFIPAGLIISARFEIKFHGSKKTTKLKVALPANADYERDSDSDWVDEWLKRRFRAKSFQPRKKEIPDEPLDPAA